ncbi:MAG: Predicted L-lactate dehydrogenase, Iron-sulfur cluster-binding subunit YkgF, partial [uncultured Acetobacteraceae bacterium]
AGHFARLQAERRPRHGGCRPAKGARHRQGRLSHAPRRRRGRPAGVRAAPRHRAGHQEPRPGQPRLLPGALRRRGGAGGRHRPLVLHGRGRAGRHPEDLPRRRRPHRHQGQVDDLRGDRGQRPPGSERHPAGGDGPRRVHHPAPAGAPLPHHRPRLPPQPRGLGSGVPPQPHRPAQGPSLRRAARHHGRGTGQAARPLPGRRRRHHRRQLPDRRDGQQRHRHQRGQRRPDADPAARPHRAGLHREGRADLGGRDLAPAPPRAERHGAGLLRLHHLLHRRAPRGRAGRAGGVPRGAARQRPLQHARHRVRRHAALHPLRRLHEPLPW